MEFFKFSGIKIDGPKDIEIKSKSDLKDKMQKGIEDVEEGKVYSLEETFEKIDKIYNK